MGFFDRFRKRVQEVADETDLEELTAEADSDEVQEALNSPVADPIPDVQDEPDEIVPHEEPTLLAEEDDDGDWDDWDDEPSPPPSPSLSKKERKQLEREKKRKQKEKKKLAKKGYDIDQVTRPDGSRVDLHMMRSTTGRKLVEVQQAPRMFS